MTEELFDMLRNSYRENRGINRLSAFNVHYVNIYDPDDIEVGTYS